MSAEKEARVRSKVKSYLKRKGYKVWIEPKVVAVSDRKMICKPDVFGIKGKYVLRGWWWEIKAYKNPVGRTIIQHIVDKVKKIQRKKDVIFLSAKGKEQRKGELKQLKVTVICGEGGFASQAKSLAREYEIQLIEPSKLKPRKRKTFWEKLWG